MKVVNRKARYDYELLNRIEVGIVLSGAEVKSVKQGKISLEESFARISPEGEVWLHNAHIHPYQFADNRDYQPTRSRKLLMHRKEILSLQKKMEGRGLSLVPTIIYSKKGRIKMELAVAKGKKKWDKRQTIKKREQNREARRVLKDFS